MPHPADTPRSRSAGPPLFIEGNQASAVPYENALLTAFVIALLWTLHPLQTESVTYIIQRAESLMGLFYLLALYAFSRSVDSPRPRIWRAASIVACLLGAGCKEVMVTAPVVILLYDRTFVAGSFRGAWQQCRWFYAGLMATWLVVGMGAIAAAHLLSRPRQSGATN